MPNKLLRLGVISCEKNWNKLKIWCWIIQTGWLVYAPLCQRLDTHPVKAFPGMWNPTFAPNKKILFHSWLFNIAVFFVQARSEIPDWLTYLQIASQFHGESSHHLVIAICAKENSFSALCLNVSGIFFLTHWMVDWTNEQTVSEGKHLWERNGEPTSVAPPLIPHTQDRTLSRAGDSFNLLQHRGPPMKTSTLPRKCLCLTSNTLFLSPLLCLPPVPKLMMVHQLTGRWPSFEY